MLKGIDVSTHQGVIDWEKVKPQIDFAILRCGFGDDIAAQDDKQYERNVSECERLGIPYGVYLYSYADSYEHIHSEVAHTLRLLQGKKPFCVYIDMEDNSTKKCGKATLTDFVKVFCEAVKAQGYKVGVYASKYWCCSFLDIAQLAACGYSVWCAQYATVEPKIDAAFDIWQYSSSGKVEGIRGKVDMNYMYKDIRFSPKAPEEGTETPKENVDVVYQTWDDKHNKWLPEVVNDTDYAGLFGNAVCAVYAKLTDGNIVYRVHTNGRWQPEVKNREDYAGVFNMPIDGLMMKTDTGKVLEYRVHLRDGARWLPWVTGYDAKDHNNGYAGILGEEIDGIQVRFRK